MAMMPMDPSQCVSLAAAADGDLDGQVQVPVAGLLVICGWCHRAQSPGRGGGGGGGTAPTDGGRELPEGGGDSARGLDLRLSNRRH